MPSRRWGQKCETSACSPVQHLTSLRSQPNLGPVGLIYFNSGKKKWAKERTGERFVKSPTVLSLTFHYVHGIRSSELHLCCLALNPLWNTAIPARLHLKPIYACFHCTCGLWARGWFWTIRILAISRVFCSGSALFCITVLRNSNLWDTVRDLGSNR